MDTIMHWILAHAMGVSVAGTALGTAALTLWAPKLTKLAAAALGRFTGKEIAAAENIKTGDPDMDARRNLAVLVLMDMANRKMPAAIGADKKAYVMSFFAKADGAVQSAVSAAVDELWSVMKASVDAGVTAPQEAIIADACAKLAALQAPAATAGLQTPVPAAPDAPAASQAPSAGSQQEPAKAVTDTDQKPAV